MITCRRRTRVTEQYKKRQPAMFNTSRIWRSLTSLSLLRSLIMIIPEATSYRSKLLLLYNSVVRRRKDSSLEIYVGLMRSLAMISNITLVQLPQLVLYMAQQYRQDSREMKNLYWGNRTFITQSDISFLRTREPPGPQECLMKKPLNFLHPLANYEGCSRNHARTWQICCLYV